MFSFSTLWYFSSDLPDYKILSNYKPPISSRVHSGDGQLIAEHALQKRLFIPYDSIPKKVIYSFLSAEDKNFFSHPGVDAKSVTRAIIKNVKNIFSTKRLEGASTITQQVAKNFLLTNEVSVKRKIKEAILAFRIEKAYSKERIMELYLNQIYLGEGTYGVAAASLEYFDKSVRNLDYDEAALLAALVAFAGTWMFFKTKQGIAMRATSFDQEAAMAQGINVHRAFAIAWASGAGLAAVAGVFASMPPWPAAGVASVDGAFFVFRALPAVILGGLDSVVGALLGGLIIGLVEIMAGQYLVSYSNVLGVGYQVVVPYLVMLLGLLVRPYGLFGTKEIRRV